MSSSIFMTEGGVAGHMAHLYDNGELKFSEIKDIFKKASSGELKGTEKTDGQNLFVSYSVKDGEAKAARNKTNIVSGGLSPAGLSSKFAGRGNLEKSFTEAFTAFEKGIQSLSKKDQTFLFGADAEIYYNAEVMDPRSPNVINYDKKSFVIHQVGHAAYNKKTGEKLDVPLKSRVVALQKVMDGIREVLAGDEFDIYVNSIRTLEALDDDHALDHAMSRLEKIMSYYDLKDGDIISDFMITRIAPIIERNIPDAPPETVELILRRILKEKINLRDIYKTAPKDSHDTIRQIVNKGTEIAKDAIFPLEDIIHDFSVEMLRGLESAYVLDNRKEVERLQKVIRNAINSIENSNNKEGMEFLTKQLKKMKKVEDYATAAEGFVFDYNGKTYKFTGNFAPANQILGLIKYGRGTIPAMLQEEDDTTRSIAVVPGAFKPPHAGHFEMIKAYASMVDQVVVFMSPLPRTTEGGRKIDFNMAKKIWNFYLEDSGLDNVRILESPVNSPVGSSFHFIANDDNNPDWAQPGDEIILGCSTKGGDCGRFGNDPGEYAREGVDVRTVPIKPATMQGEFKGINYSAGNMRGAIDDNDIKTLSWYIPDDSVHRVGEIMKVLSQKKKVVRESNNNLSISIFNMISEVLRENTSAGGAIQGAPSIKKEQPLEEEDFLTVKGGSMDINIDTMPQIAKEERAHFIEWVLANDVRVQKGKIPISKLKPTQMQIDKDVLAKMEKQYSTHELQNDMPIIIGNDNQILDGHHRWYTLLQTAPTKSIKAYKIDKNIDDLIKFTKDYPHVSYKRTN